MESHKWTPERCNGPGAKEIFSSRAAAREALLTHWKGKRANARQGKVYPCRWGDHWHFTSRRNPGRLR